MTQLPLIQFPQDTISTSPKKPRKIAVSPYTVASEYDECRAYWQWAQTRPILREYLYKCVNEGKRDPRAGRNLKLIGLTAGLPDYHLPYPSGSHPGLWIEMKRKMRYTISEQQAEWIVKLRRVGHKAEIAYGCDDAIKITQSYLEIP